MSHLPILPVLIPLVVAIVQLVLPRQSLRLQRALSIISALVIAIIAVALLMSSADGTIRVYRLGAWPAPYGIVLVVDRLAALMVALTAVLFVSVVLSSIADTDARGRHFHALLQLQVAGLNGAFLTGDLFNLFVFFEILLLASYTLLAHGGGRERSRAGLTYVILNLTGSALFLIALGLTYGTLGTLTMADIGVMLARVPVSDQPLVRTTMALLVAVFLLKAAALPLGFWLPHVYSAAFLPVAALFVIMTKVGIYALLRVSTIAFSAAQFTAGLLEPWLPWIAIGTIALGSVGLLAANRLAVVVANLVLISSGTLLLGVGTTSVKTIEAAIYYLIHTTVATSALFLLVEALARERASFADTLQKGPRLVSLEPLGFAFLVLAVAASGTPPLSGFLGKVMVMQSLWAHNAASAVWAALLVSSVVSVLVLARAASTIFWEPGKVASDVGPSDQVTLRPGKTPIVMLLMVLLSLTVTLAARPIAAYARAAAEQVSDRPAYVTAVLGDERAIQRERRP